MADVAIQFSLETIRDLLIEEGRFLHGVSDEVKKVERELKTIHCILMDADKWPDRHKTAILADWINELGELASRAEYVLEKYGIEVTSRRGGNLMKKVKRGTLIFGEWLTVHQVGKEVEAIRSNLSILTGRLGSMGPGGSSSNSREDERHLSRITFEHDDVKQHFVGMEEDIASLVSLVKDRERRNRVISIYGMGGLGKTTLARKIYHHKGVVIPYFEARAWVCATQQFQATAVLRQILKQLFTNDEEKSRIGGMEYPELVKALYDVQMQKRCLIVIDDIWESGHWSILEPAFPIENDQCKVVLTTRSEKVGPRGCLYKLNYLTEDQGWELLQNIALPKDLETKQSLVLETVGRQMVKKCGCLPLAIEVLGGILREKQTASEWQRVNEDVDSYLKRGDEKVKQVLDLSYNSLPYYLKPCFLYLGCFGEDEEIDTERLYLLWMADGLIPYEEKGKNETLRDVAERYLIELATRCMVQVQKDEYSTAYNKFKSCRLHDLMRDLCLSKGEEKGFLKLIDLCGETKYVPPDVHSTSILAVRYDWDSDDCFHRGEVMKDLRCLILVQKTRHRRMLKFGSKGSGTDFNKLKRLRTLALENGELLLSNEVGKLIHLRYLSLFDSRLKELPLSITNLTYLETLDLRMRNMGADIKVPNVICKMKRLRHLFIGNIDVIGDCGDELILDGLEELETLRDESYPSRVCVADIPKLTNLRYLKSSGRDKDEIWIIANHMSGENIRLREAHLQISDCGFDSEEPSNNNNLRKILMSPSLTTLVLWTKFTDNFRRYQQGMGTNLVDFTLHDRSGIGRGDLMEILGQFPALKRLELFEVRFLNREMRCLATSFPQLKFLNLHCLTNLESWVVDEGAMANLSSLKISSCERLEMIPDGLRFVTTLRELKTFMPKDFNDRLRKGTTDRPGKDYHKVCHVPSMLLGDWPG